MLPFIFSTCQIGAETAFKKEIARSFPDMRPAFARPGFVSFKCGGDVPDDRRCSSLLRSSVFARCAAVSMGKIESADFDRIAAEVWRLTAENRLFVNRVHVFCRDPFPPDKRDFEPHIPPELIDLHRSIIAKCPQKKFLGTGADDLFHPAENGETVLDVAVAEPELIFAGYHDVPAGNVSEDCPVHCRYSGGIIPLTLPPDAVSRAWLKFSEGLRWSGFSVQKGDRVLDIGASPGGCSQFLLSLGAEVIGIDPGETAPAVRNQPGFQHIRSKVRGVKHSVFQNVRYMTADMNVAPNYTLDVLEEIVTKNNGSIRGMLFTLKLIHWELADQLPKMLERIRHWKNGSHSGFADVRCRQLVFNRQEVMVAARTAAARDTG
ncbi:MAG: hypothetical protein LBH00_04325 [Planctomycetaceae bacterium]|nr:hypothetical protein [Planctomycetaceae bacterium]